MSMDYLRQFLGWIFVFLMNAEAAETVRFCKDLGVLPFRMISGVFCVFSETICVVSRIRTSASFCRTPHLIRIG